MRDNENPSINWGDEVLRVLGIIGKVLLRILSYFLNIFLTVLLVGLITGIIVGTVFAIYINNYLDLEVDKDMYISVNSDSATRIYLVEFETEEDRKNRIGKEVEIQRLTGDESTIAVKYSQLPKNLINAFIAIEDKRFETHNGVDWIGTGKAFLGFVGLVSDARGGSTITQQLIKNVTGEDDVTIQRKVEEIFRALNLEKELSKEQILEMYMNIIYLGNGCDGVQSAANYYFGKDVSELSLVECAAIASIVKNPSQYEPKYHDKDRYVMRNGKEVLLEGNQSRRWVVLDQMRENGMISEAECEAAWAEELKIISHDYEEEDTSEGMEIYSWYIEAVIEKLIDELAELYGVDQKVASLMLYNNGYKIVIPMDPEIQDIMEDVYLNDTEYFPSSGKGLQPQSSMVVCDPYTGDVLGLVGGRGEKTLNRGIERAASKKFVRPPGSSIKPLSVYAPAIDSGLIHYGSVLDDTPVMFNSKVEVAATANNEAILSYSAYPHNLPDVYNGLTTVHSAVRTSKNTIAMKVLQKLSIDRSFDFMKNTLNFNSLIESYTTDSGQVLTDRGLAALALGQPNFGVTLLEMTSAYSIFPNDGMYTEPKLILYVKDSDDNVILDFDKEPEVVISVETASIMTEMLKEVMNAGTGTSCQLRHTVNVAGKTGTTSSDFDRYFVGYTPYFVGGVWSGYDHPQSLSSFPQNLSIAVWDAVMTKIHEKYVTAAANGGEPLKTFELAPGVITATYCPDSGKLCTDACALDPRGNRVETGYFTRESVPKDFCDVHVKVLRDNSTGLIASPNCNPKDCSEVALIRVEDRNFPVEIYVGDAQYVYRELPADVKPGGWWGIPFFQNMLPEKTYVGSCYVDNPYNAYCYKHCDYRPWGGYGPAEDSGYTPEGSDYDDERETERETEDNFFEEDDILGGNDQDDTEKESEREEIETRGDNPFVNWFGGRH